jgi:hypothetical protein
MRELGVEPNFFMSEEYLLHKRITPATQSNGLWGLVEDGEDGWFLPPLNGAGQLATGESVYAGLPNVAGSLFVDYQFIYDPQRFQDLSGGCWAVYRKNIRKWPRRSSVGYCYRELNSQDEDQVADLLEVWCRGNSAIYDPEAIARAALFGQYRWGLFSGDVLVGLNTCDLNWKYINFRVCIDSGQPFLQEYLRHCFYTSDFVQELDKLVNDGGCLGSESLRKFKMKLNPLRVDRIYGKSKMVVPSLSQGG